MLSRIRHHSHVLESVIVEALPCHLDLPVDHGRRCHHVSTSAGMAYRNLSELLKRPIIIHTSIIDKTTVAMARVLAHTDVSENDQFVPELIFQIMDRLLDYPVRLICSRPDFVLNCWNPE